MLPDHKAEPASAAHVQENPVEGSGEGWEGELTPTDSPSCRQHSQADGWASRVGSNQLGTKVPQRPWLIRLATRFVYDGPARPETRFVYDGPARPE